MFLSTHLNYISAHLNYERCILLGQTPYPSSYTKLYNDAMAAELNFNSKESYLEWIKHWRAMYAIMTANARSYAGVHHTKEQRWAMMHIRMEAKRKALEAKEQRVTT
jgi:uncharacterized protein YqiB (DUF1249 family)